MDTLVAIRSGAWDDGIDMLRCLRLNGNSEGGKLWLELVYRMADAIEGGAAGWEAFRQVGAEMCRETDTPWPMFVGRLQHFMGQQPEYADYVWLLSARSFGITGNTSLADAARSFAEEVMARRSQAM